jgi:hypothetical protein
MQCLHEKDLSQWLLEGGNGEKWERLCLPVINADGTALWPEKHSIEELKRMQAAAPHTFAAQYMQQPTSPGGSFFAEANFLVDGQPVPTPLRIDSVFAVIDTAVKTGSSHDGLAVIYCALCRTGITYPLHVLDWHLLQLEGGFLINWLPTVFTRLEELCVETQCRLGSAGAWIEDKVSGSILIQQARQARMNARAIDSKLTAMGKSERAINISGHVFKGSIKFTKYAYEKTVTFKGATKNHLMKQVLSFFPGDQDNVQDDCLDTLTYAVALSLGSREGF